MICLVLALACEAKPLLARYRLQALYDVAGYRIYRNETVALIVSGPGRIAAAGAVGYLQGLLGARDHAWLNIGVGGHREYAIGELVLARRVLGDSSRWYPPPVIEAPCAMADILTVDRPEHHYPENVVYEMEAAGFYPSACRFASAELIQVLKVISDNTQHPAKELDAKRISTLIEHHLDGIDHVVRQLLALSAELTALQADPPQLAECLARWHFTTAQRFRLRELLQRYHILYPQAALQAQQLSLPRARNLLDWLEQRIAAAPLPY